MNAMTRITLVFVLCCSFTAVVAQDNADKSIGFKGIGGSLGLVKPSYMNGTISLNASADLGEISHNLVLFPTLSYWQKSWRYGNDDAEKVSFREIGLQVDAHYYFPMKSAFDLYAGGGAGLFIFSASANGSSASTTQFGFSLLGGVEYPIGDNAILFGELKQKFGLGGTSDGYGVASLNTFGLYGGFRYSI